MRHPINKGSFVWHRVMKQWLRIITSANSNGNTFSATTKSQFEGTHPADLFEVRRSEVIPLSAVVGFKGNSGSNCYKQQFNFSDHRHCEPLKDGELKPLELLAIGDHVTLMKHTGYAGVVTKIDTEYRGDFDLKMYKVRYYEVNTAKNTGPGYRIPISYNASFPEYTLEKRGGVAPRFQLDPEKHEKLKRKIAVNMRAGCSPFNARWFRRAEKKVNGAIVAKFLAEAKAGKVDMICGDDYAVMRALRELEASKRGALVALAVEYKPSVDDYIKVCPNCGSVHNADDSRYSDYHDERFCIDCSDGYYYSEMMGDYINVDSALGVYESLSEYRNDNPRDYCIEGRERGEYTTFYSSRYGTRIVSYDAIEEVEEWLEETDNGGSGLSGYHNIDRVWKETWVDKRYVPLGVELEVYAEPRRAAVMAVKKALPKQAYLERDGSLNSDYGFEVISQPFGKTEWATIGVTLLNTLKENNAVAWNDPAGSGYGIHVNISRAYLSSLQEARMFMFLAAQENRDFVWAIAQRDTIYAADVDMGSTSKRYQKVKEMGGLDNRYIGDNPDGSSKYKKVMRGRGKYTPVNFHGDRLEIRIFQSTLNKVSFYKNLEFTWALVEWTNTKTASGTSWMHTDFVKWLGARPHVEVDYPNLIAYLRKDSFSVMCKTDEEDESDTRTVRSTWQDLIPKPVRCSISKEVTRRLYNEATQDEVEVTAPAYIRSVPKAAEMYAMAA